MLRCALGLLLFASWTLAQSTAASDAGQLFQLNISATNGKGEPVTTLKADDIQVREDGKTQPLVFFRFASKQSTMTPPKQGEFANFGNRQAQVPVVILLDRWNESLVSTTQSGIGLSAAIQALESVDRVYIYYLNNRGELVPLRALPGATAEANLSPAELHAKLDEALRASPGFHERDDLSLRITKTFRGLEALTAQVGLIPGRKDLLWISSGFPLVIRVPGASGFIDFTPQMRGLSEMAAQGQIAVYTVDQSTQGAGASVGGQARALLNLYSALTGGRWNPSDAAAHAIDDIRVDARGSYRVGYVSRARGHDGQFHKIRVETARKGVHLLTREGFAGNAVAAPAEQVETAVLAGARRSGLDAAEIGLRVGMSHMPGARTTRFDIHVDPSDLFIEKGGEHGKARVDVMVALYYNGGLLKDSTQVTRMDLSVDPAELDKAADGVLIPVNVAVSDDIQQAKVMVFDPYIQALGSVTIPIK